MIRVARENLREVFSNMVMGQLLEDVSSILESRGIEINQLLFISKDKAEYEVLK
jgi:hypothetical protein